MSGRAALVLLLAAVLLAPPAAARRPLACPAGKHPRAERWTVRIHGRDRRVTVRICRRNRPPVPVGPVAGTPPAPVPASTTPTSTAPAGAPPPPAPAPPTAQSLQVQAREFSFTLSRATLLAGATTLEFLNRGEDPHDLHIRPADASDDATTPFPELAPGGRTLRTLTLPAGAYVLYCAVPGHEALGMHAPLTVLPAG